MTIADLFKELHDTAKERIKNPIMGAFICSFFVCNWQAIFILFFSDMSIEERIEFMNTKWKILQPILISIGYTVLVPLIMIGLDYVLMPMKQKRISNIYKNRSFTTDQKIKLASKEFALKNAENGNKSLEEMENKMKELASAHEKIRETDRLTIENLKASLESSNNMVLNLQNQIDVNSNILEDFSFPEILEDGTITRKSPAGVLREIEVGNTGLVLNGEDRQHKFLIHHGLAQLQGKDIVLTSTGRNLWREVNGKKAL